MSDNSFDVVVIGGNASFAQFLRLDIAELAESHTDFHAEFADFAHGREHLLEFGIAIAYSLPRRPHAKTRGAIGRGLAGNRYYLLGGH